MTTSNEAQLIALWIRQYNPTASVENLAESFSADQHLVKTLLALKSSVDGTYERERKQQVQLEQAQQKIQTLRTSLSHFSSHASSLSDRLFLAESSLLSQKHHSVQQLGKVEEERAGLRALCQVWEGRWREERTRREEVEEKLREATSANDGKKLNGATERDETRMVASKDLQRSVRSGRSRSPNPPSAESWRTKSSSISETTTKESIVADLVEDTNRLKAEMSAMNENRDIEVAQLEAELRLRRSEMSQLYSSLDKLLFLSATPIQSVDPAPVLSSSTTTSGTVASGRRKSTISPSILDLPAVQAAAAHSRSRRSSELPAGDQTIEEMGNTLRLEEEIREMERKIRMLSGGPESEGSSVEPEDGSALRGNGDDQSARLLQHIRELEADLTAVRKQLEVATKEKESLERLVGKLDKPRSSDGVEREEAQRAYIERLEADRYRLSQLLEASESEAESLSQELSSMHAQVDALSERVRLKLEEQRNKLKAAYAEIERLRNQLERT
ncbi:uncharacterized protein JCM6883_001580 [Sporobolomyces salmoneus]|uniref:uncharacterized protein n=1 Tax=Sporobolomyces salmoneus TaxID=183962 RepID=UPI00317D28E0